MEEAGIEFFDDLVMVLGIPEREIGVVCETAGLFGDDFHHVEIGVGFCCISRSALCFREGHGGLSDSALGLSIGWRKIRTKQAIAPGAHF